VSIGDALPTRPDAACVLFDNPYGVSTALEHLAGLGHRSIGILAPSLPSTPGRPAEVLGETLGAVMNLDVTVASSPPSVAGAAGAAHQMLSVTPRPTALFCLSDSIAFGAYHAAREMNLTVPDDLSVLGFDDSALASLVSPALTTFGWDEQAIVDAAVGYLAEPADGEARSNTTSFRPEFLERASTAPPPAFR
jgi:LacI family transcriptional regulator